LRALRASRIAYDAEVLRVRLYARRLAVRQQAWRAIAETTVFPMLVVHVLRLLRRRVVT
jgi:hypothetical protein